METKNVPSGLAGLEDIVAATADDPGGEGTHAKVHEQRDVIGKLSHRHRGFCFEGRWA
jgi:hypothetical protein